MNKCMQPKEYSEMLKRKADERISNWIAHSRNALLVTGARQVGKTWSIRKCLEDANVDWLEINLIREPELIPVLEKSASVEDLIINLTAVRNHSFQKGKTILFVDEIQEAKDVITKVKFWVEEGSLRYVFSGSLLGIELKGLRSAPVGSLDEIEMFPLDFEEFLTASGVQAETLEYLAACFERLSPIAETVHEKMMQHFQRYLVVGGMPAAVQEYVDSRNMEAVSNIQRNIIRLYKLDFTKYEEIEKRLKLISVYDQIPSQMMKQNRRFCYADLQKGLRFEKLEDSFLWLSAAGVAIPVYNATAPRIALSQNQKSSLLKLYSSDVGLLSCQYGNAIRLSILMGDQKINLGGIYENAVAQSLNAQGYPMFFYNSHKYGELDFLIEQATSVVPIEVKSGKDYYIHSALSKALSNPEYEIQKAYVLSGSNVSQEGRIIYMPVYLCMYLKDRTVLPVLPEI